MAACQMPVPTLGDQHHGPHTGIVQLCICWGPIDPSPHRSGSALNAELVIHDSHWVTDERRRSGLSLSLHRIKLANSTSICPRYLWSSENHMDPISFFCLFKNPQREVVSNQKTRLWSGRRTYVLTGNENEGHRLDNGDFRHLREQSYPCNCPRTAVSLDHTYLL